MPYVNITPELANVIRYERTSRNISVKDIQSKIGKSLAYFSKIENAKVNKIDLNILYSIFECIIGKENINSYMSNLLEKFQTGLTKKEIQREEWMHTFDLQYRQLPISNDIIKYIQEKLTVLGLTSIDIIEKLNKNEDLENASQYSPNKVYAKMDELGNLISSIRFSLPTNYLDNILTGKIKTINYINILGIIYTILKFEGKSVDVARKKAKEALYEHKFYTLFERNQILSKNKLDKDLDYMLSSEDKDYFRIQKEISIALRAFGDQDIKYAVDKFGIFSENLKQEPSISLALIGISLVELKGLSTDRKKEFILDVKKLIQEYAKVEPEKLLKLD